jgi:RNA polymerase sigma-70 factor (ECF subfamily)
MNDAIQAALDRGEYRTAFEQMLPLYRDRVLRLAAGMLRDRTLAEDVAQDVFVRVWRALPAFEGRSALSTWIYAIARNACLAELRKRRPEVSLDSDERGQDPGWRERVAPEPDDRATRSVLEVLDRLPQRQREVVILYYVEDRSVEETAAVLGAPTGTVKALLHRARKRLVELIGPASREEDA